MHNHPPARPHWSTVIHSIQAQVKKHPEILIASDFDGTLSPIVERPEEAVLADSTRSALLDLASHYPDIRLAFLSGRSLDDLMPRVNIGNATVYAGNHGLEISSNGHTWIHPTVKAGREHLDRLLVDFDQRFIGIPGIEIEDKGYSVTLHYRRMIPEWLPLLNQAISKIVLDSSLRQHEGKMVHEFRPAIDWNKGLAIRRIAKEMEIPHAAVIFLGDDVTDEDAFRELGSDAITVHVGSANQPSLARFNADSPEDVAAFLRAILQIKE